MSHEPREHFHELLTRFSHGMLVTRTPGGDLRARPLVVAAVDADDDVWFVTKLGSGKVAEILKDSHVCVTFQDGARYLSLTGAAVVVYDSDRVEQLWKERWRVWFPGGPGDPQIVLLHVKAESGEYWDRGGLVGIKYLFRAGYAYLAGRENEPTPEEHQTVRLKSSPLHL